MRFMIVTAAAFGLGLAVPALAATNPPGAAGMGNSQAANSQSTPSGMALQQHIRQELAQGGFTDIQVMPQSFLVRAKDREGNPVMMVISPNSVTAVTALSAGQPGQNGAGNGAMGSSAMTNSAHAGNAINAPNGNGTPTH